MNLPNKILPYASALLSAPWKFNLTYVSAFVDKSHDFLTRTLKKTFRWKTLLQHLLLHRDLDDGYLIVDETDVDKSYAKKINGLGWIFSNRKKSYIFGLHLVVVVWTNTKRTIPIAWKIYRKGSGKTKTDLALELMDYCTFVLRITPKAWLFDSFYASERILKFMSKNNLLFYSQLQRNRLFDTKQLKSHEKGRPYWTKCGYIKGKVYVQVVKNRRKYFVTNDTDITRKEHLDIYRIRWKIEEVFRFVKQELGFEKCQCTSLRAQNNHFGVCFMLYALLQDISAKTQMTVYQIKLKATFDRSFVESLNLAAYLEGA